MQINELIKRGRGGCKWLEAWGPMMKVGRNSKKSLFVSNEFRGRELGRGVVEKKKNDI